MLTEQGGRERQESHEHKKQRVKTDPEEGAEGYCEGGAQVLFNSKVFDWLDKTLT